MNAIVEQPPKAPANAPDWATRIVQDVVAWVQRRSMGPQQMASYTVAGVPDATKFLNQAIIVSNESGGRTIATSDGTHWKRCKDGANIS